MKKILYIIVILAFCVTTKAQTYVADTTDLKLIPSVNNGKVAVVVGTAYQGTYTATNTESTPNAATVFASIKTGWYWIKVQEYEIVDATRYGMKNDGTSISASTFLKFITNTNGKMVYWPAGTYNFAAGAVDINPSVDINWYGDKDQTILNNFDDFSPVGDLLIVRDMSIKNSDYAFRYDASETAANDTIRYAEFSGLYCNKVQGLIRMPETSEIWPEFIRFANIRYDTVASNGLGIAVNGGAGIIEAENLYFNWTEDSTWFGALTLASEQDGGRGIDTSVYVNNVVITNYYSAEGFGNPANLYSFYCEAQGGTFLKVSNIKINHTNLPLIYLRGVATSIFDNIDIRSTSVRSDFLGPAVICKTIRNDDIPAFIFRNSHVEITGVPAVYKENQGDVIIKDNFIKTSVSGGYALNFSIGAAQSHISKLRVEGNTVINASSSSPQTMNASSEYKDIRVLNNSFILSNNSVASGANTVFAAGASQDTSDYIEFSGNYFYGARMNTGVRYANIFKFNDNHVVGSGTHGLSALKQSLITNNLFEGFPTDSATANSSSYDWSLDFSSTPNVLFDGNQLNLDNVYRVYNADISQTSGQVDTLVYRNNFGRINSVLNGSSQKILRIDTINYLEVSGNNINFPRSGQAHIVFLENGINYANIFNNSFTNNGTNATYFFAGISAEDIYNLKFFNNVGFDDVVDANITVNYDSIKTSQLYALNGNAYITGDTLAFYQLIPDVITAGTSRNLASTDVENIVRCTTSITLTIPLNFSAMAVEQTITVLKAFAGTNITITGATGVTVNGSSGGSATITGDYKAGIIYKVSTNTYEVY